MHGVLLGALLVLAPSLTREEIGLLTSVVAERIARDTSFDVLAAADVRRVLELEGAKQTMGCAESSSCLAEVAGALGARYVVIGDVGTIGASSLLNVSIWDSSKGETVSRKVFRGRSLDELLDVVDKQGPELAAGMAAQRGRVKAGERTKVVVLDFRLSGEESAPAATPAAAPPTAAAPFPWLLVGGVTALGGALGVGIGAVAGVMSLDKHAIAIDRVNTTQIDAEAAALERDSLATTANVCYVVGGVVAAVGVGVAAVDFVGGGAE